MAKQTYCTAVFTIATRTALDSCNPNGCADEFDCKTFRSTEGYPVELPDESRTSAGKQGLSLGSKGISPTPLCPSSSLSDSCCNVSYGRSTLVEAQHCNADCYGSECNNRLSFTPVSPRSRVWNQSADFHGLQTGSLSVADYLLWPDGFGFGGPPYV